MGLCIHNSWLTIPALTQTAQLSKQKTFWFTTAQLSKQKTFWFTREEAVSMRKLQAIISLCSRCESHAHWLSRDSATMCRWQCNLSRFTLHKWQPAHCLGGGGGLLYSGCPGNWNTAGPAWVIVAARLPGTLLSCCHEWMARWC